MEREYGLLRGQAIAICRYVDVSADFAGSLAKGLCGRTPRIGGDKSVYRCIGGRWHG